MLMVTRCKTIYVNLNNTAPSGQVGAVATLQVNMVELKMEDFE